MVDFTTVVAVDKLHLEELKLVWPTWKMHRTEILGQRLLLICDAIHNNAEWEAKLRFVDHPDKEVVLWDLPGADQREKMLTSLVIGTCRHVTTPWYLKLDTDVVACAPGAWLQPEWFRPDNRGRTPAFVASPWGYSRPADAIDRLDRWAATKSELQSYPPLELHAIPGATLVKHPRIISWCFFGNTEWTKSMVTLCGDRLPVPSQDTFLWYCAARRRDLFRRVRMSRYQTPSKFAAMLFRYPLPKPHSHNPWYRTWGTSPP